MSYYSWDEDYYYDKKCTDDFISADAYKATDDLLEIVFEILSFFIYRMEFTNSALVALIPVLLTKDNGYETKYYWLMFGTVFIVSLFLQFRFILFRIIYGAFTCLVVAFFCYIWDSSLPMSTRYTTVAIGVGITIFLNLISWGTANEL